MALYAGYGDNIILHDADGLIVHRCQDPCIVILEYEVHGKAVATGALYENRFISVVTIAIVKSCIDEITWIRWLP
jgi:uncharacterized protein